MVCHKQPREFYLYSCFTLLLCLFTANINNKNDWMTSSINSKLKKIISLFVIRVWSILISHGLNEVTGKWISDFFAYAYRCLRRQSSAQFSERKISTKHITSLMYKMLVCFLSTFILFYGNPSVNRWSQNEETKTFLLFEIFLSTLQSHNFKRLKRLKNCFLSFFLEYIGLHLGSLTF